VVGKHRTILRRYTRVVFHEGTSGPRCPIEALSECRVAWTDFGSYFSQRRRQYRKQRKEIRGPGTLTAIPNPATHDGASVKSFQGDHRVGPSLLSFLAELNEPAILEKGRQR
jgi:hypothetical protein